MRSFDKKRGIHTHTPKHTAPPKNTYQLVNTFCWINNQINSCHHVTLIKMINWNISVNCRWKLSLLFCNHRRIVNFMSIWIFSSIFIIIFMRSLCFLVWNTLIQFYTFPIKMCKINILKKIPRKIIFNIKNKLFAWVHEMSFIVFFFQIEIYSISFSRCFFYLCS